MAGIILDFMLQKIQLKISVVDYSNKIINHVQPISDVQLTTPFSYDNNVDFNPQSGSPALSGSSFSDPKFTKWFTPVTYRGACDAADLWWKAWTRFNY